MESYKQKFIDFLINAGALKVGDDYTLKSNRISPWFLNIGDFNYGPDTAALGNAYAGSIVNSGIDFDGVYGIPEKGVGLAIATSTGLANLGVSKYWFFTRKMPKDYGEATNLSKADKRKSRIVGRTPLPGDKLILADDVLTTSESKHNAINELNELLDDPKYAAVSIAADRQEVGIDGISAVDKFVNETKIPVISIVNASDIYSYLKENAADKLPGVQAQIDELTRKQQELLSAQTKEVSFEREKQKIKSDLDRMRIVEKTLKPESLTRMEKYLRVYGTKKAKEYLGKAPEHKIIDLDRSVIPACDVATIEEFERIVEETADLEKIGAYKVGFELGLGYGLPEIMKIAREHTDKPIIYDHQKAGTDIPDTGKNFARVCKKAGVDAVILFPQAGPETERAWIYHALDHDLNVIVGGWMTHPAFVTSEGGFIEDEKALEIYRIAAGAGVNDFVIPGNKLDKMKLIKEIVEAEGANPTYYSPGLVTQKGDIAEGAKVAGNKWHAIIGRGIFQSPDMRNSAIEHTSKI